MDISWKNVAQDRLSKLRAIEYQCERLRYCMAYEIEKELVKNLFACCIPRNLYEGKAKTIAEAVADRLKPEVP